MFSYRVSDWVRDVFLKSKHHWSIVWLSLPSLNSFQLPSGTKCSRSWPVLRACVRACVHTPLSYRSLLHLPSNCFFNPFFLTPPPLQRVFPISTSLPRSEPQTSFCLFSVDHWYFILFHHESASSTGCLKSMVFARITFSPPNLTDIPQE